MNRISRNLSIILRAERIIARRQMSVVRQQTGMMAAAGLVAGLGLIMLNVAAYLGLSTVMSPAWAALIVAGVNLAAAALLVAAANRINAEKEIEGAQEVRDMAIADLEAEVDLAARELRDVAENVSRIAKDPLGSALPGLLGPIIGMLLKQLSKK